MVETVGKFLAGPVGSWLRVFAAGALGLYFVDLQDPNLTLGLTDYATAGLVSVLPIILAWLNPSDPRFGKAPAPSPLEQVEFRE